MILSKLLASNFAPNPLFGGMTNIRIPASQRTYHQNQPIYTIGDRAEEIYVIISGRVEVSLLSERGRKKILYLLSEGEAFGELAFVCAERTEMAMAWEPTVVKVVSIDQIRRLIERDGQFALWFSHLLGQRLAFIQQEVGSQTFDPTKWRLMKTLLRLAEKFGVREGNVVRIVGFTHETLAQLLGVYRETVSQWMRSLAAEHLISCQRKGISIQKDVIEGFSSTWAGKMEVDEL